MDVASWWYRRRSQRSNTHCKALAQEYTIKSTCFSTDPKSLLSHNTFLKDLFKWYCRRFLRFQSLGFPELLVSTAFILSRQISWDVKQKSEEDMRSRAGSNKIIDEIVGNSQCLKFYRISINSKLSHAPCSDFEISPISTVLGVEERWQFRFREKTGFSIWGYRTDARS